MNQRLELFRRSLDECTTLLASHPEAGVLESVIAQLEYLIALETGQSTDRSRLGEIIVGVQAAREIEPLSLSLADLLYDVSDEVDKM